MVCCICLSFLLFFFNHHGRRALCWRHKGRDYIMWKCRLMRTYYMSVFNSILLFILYTFFAFCTVIASSIFVYFQTIGWVWSVGCLRYDQGGYNRHCADANKSALGTFFCDLPLWKYTKQHIFPVDSLVLCHFAVKMCLCTELRSFVKNS